jgi:chondroitin AC lyase
MATVIFATCGRTLDRAVSAEDMAQLRDNVLAWYTRGAPAALTVRSYLRTMKPNGSWPDVDYANTDRGGWTTYQHLSRVLALAQAYSKAGHTLAGNVDLRAAIEKTLAHWVREDYRNTNWWYPQIGVPLALAPTLVLMGDDIPSELRDRAIGQILSRSKMGMTGQNKVWLAGIAFLKGMLQGDGALMTQARDRILEELCITTAEGVQPDYSFHQHGPQLQWGNYGASFGGNMIQWASIFQGTAYAVDPVSFRILGDYLAEGPAWVLWRGRMDISGCGRQIFRGSQKGKGQGILGQLQLMASVDPEHADRYRHLLAANRPGTSNPLVGHKHFWRSDISVHRRPTWYASVKMSSTRVIGAETCNSENMLGLHLGDGVTYFHRTGTEYQDLFPVWDWQRLPGTTCTQSDEILVPNSKRCRGRSDFVGGVSDGHVGAAAMEYVRDGLRARKAWFFLDQAVVCLGAGIGCDDPDPVLTSINQCALRGPMTVSTGPHVRQVPMGDRLTDRLSWVHHDGMGYAFPKPLMVTVHGATQSGDWHRVHHRESRRTVERDVFNLWIDHGTKPKEAQYAYAVLPNVTVAGLRASEHPWPVTVLQQAASLLAISSDGGKRVQAAFFEAGRLAWEGDSILEVDAPCLVLLDRTATPTRLYVAEPTHRRGVLNVRLAGRDQADLMIELPADGQAGRTVSVELRQ